jgi:hypothetical protein
MGAGWTCLLVWILLNPYPRPFGGEHTKWLTLVSMLFPVYYLVTSWWVSLRLWRKHRSRMAAERCEVLPQNP